MGRVVCERESIKGDFQSYVDYRFLVINNRHSALMYFFHYNHGLNSNKWAYFNRESSNCLKVYIFGRCKLRGIIWYIIHANQMKIWPHLTFEWPFVNISITIHPTYSKLYIFVILITSRVIWYTWKVIWSILKFWPLFDLCVTPTGKGQIVQNFVQIFSDLQRPQNHQYLIRKNGTWVLLSLQSSLWPIISCSLKTKHNLEVRQTIHFWNPFHKANNLTLFSEKLEHVSFFKPCRTLKVNGGHLGNATIFGRSEICWLCFVNTPHQISHF